MLLNASRGARLLAIGLAGALTALAGCQDGQKMDTAYVARSSTGEVIPGRDRGPTHNAPYARSDYEAPPPAPAPKAAPSEPAPTPAAKPAPRRTGSTVCSPSVPAGYSASGLAFPTGDPASSAIMVHQVMPDEVAAGEEFMYEYQLCNLTDGTLQNVALTVEDTQNLQIVRSEPAGSTGNGRTFWNLGDLGPRESTTVKVWAKAGSVGTASNCITVSYNNVLCAQTRVVQPALSLTKTATSSALLCETIEYVFEVRNTGTGVARNVHLTDTFPAGVTTADGKSSIDIAIGDLAAGEGKRITIPAKASKTGTFDNTASANADGGLKAQSGTASTTITAPKLEIAADCSERTFIGRNFTHSYTVRNSGNGECNNTSVVVNLPAGTQFVRASTGGVQQGNAVSFNLDNVPAGAQRTVSVTMSAAQQGDFTSSASVSCVCSEAATESCTTAVRGIPALLLEVIDVEDPDEVGTTEEYIISVTNQGSAPATGIRIVAQLPAEQEYVSDTGATKASVSGRTVTFAPYGPLAPKAKAEWKVTVRCIGEGDVRFAVEMTADQLTRPVNETESTNLYR